MFYRVGLGLIMYKNRFLFSVFLIGIACTALFIAMERNVNSLWQKQLPRQKIQPTVIDHKRGSPVYNNKIYSHIQPARLIVETQRNKGLRKLERKLLDGPDKRTEFNNVPDNFKKEHKPRNITSKWLLQPNAFDFSKGKIFMLIIVKTAVHSRERRNNVRQSWGAVAKINNRRFVTLFLVGRVENKTLQASIEAENKEYGDILQCDINDDYVTLPDKVLAAYQWVTYVTGDVSDYYAFTDDDCVINMALTYDYFTTNQRKFVKDGTMHCPFMYSAQIGPAREGKYSLSKETYSFGHLAPFCHGGFIVMMFPMLSDIYRQAQITPRYDMHLEDVFITGILRTKLGKNTTNIKLVYDDNVYPSTLHYMGPFVWHIGSNNEAFFQAWHIVYDLMDRTTGNGKIIHRGFWPGSENFAAQITDAALVPANDSNRVELFLNNFGYLIELEESGYGFDYVPRKDRIVLPTSRLYYIIGFCSLLSAALVMCTERCRKGGLA